MKPMFVYFEQFADVFSTASQCVSDVGAELAFVLPKSNTARFPALFQALDVEKPVLRITGYGISVTTMEDVFLRVCLLVSID